MRQGTDRPDISERLNGTHAEGDYDALADLFLGEPPAKHPPHATPAPSASTHSSNDDLGTPHGPCCSRVGPIGGAATAKPSSRRVDVLVLGHLPGLGGTWASQHARAAAMHLGAPVCLLRLSDGQLVIDLVWPDDARVPAFPACTEATAAIRLAAQHAGAWLLRLQGRDEAALDEWFAGSLPATGTGPAIDRVRLLTGADDAAIVAAYRRLKAWHAASPHAFGRMARVTIVEPDGARAAAAEARLRKAAASFLETQLAPAEILGAMRPVRVSTLYCGPFDSPATEALALVRKTSAEVPQGPHAPTGAAAPSSQATASPAVSVVAKRATDPARAGDALTGTHAVVPTNGVHPEPHAPPTPVVHSVPVQVPLRPATFGRDVHTPTADQIISMIARSAGIDTLRAAATVCPWAPAIVLAVDAQGESHAIAFARDEGHVSLAAVDLLTTSRWCAEHAPLLAMAGVTPRASDTTLHLLTTAPAAARRLADTGLRVHAAVRIGESWGAVALS